MELMNELKRAGLQVHYCTDDECIAFRNGREYRVRFSRDRLEVWRHEPDESESYEDFAESCAGNDDIDKCIEERMQKALDYWNTKEEELMCNLGRVKLFRRYVAVEGDYGVDVYRVLAATGEIDMATLLPFMIEHAQ